MKIPEKNIKKTHLIDNSKILIMLKNFYINTPLKVKFKNN